MVMECIGWYWMDWMGPKKVDCSGLYQLVVSGLPPKCDPFHIGHELGWELGWGQYGGLKDLPLWCHQLSPLLFKEPTWPAGSAGARPVPPPSHTLFTFVASFRPETESL